MKDPKNDSTPVLERFGRDKRKRTVVATAERVERRPRLQRDAADSEQPSFENRPERRASYNPHFTADNRPVFEKPHYGDKSRGRATARAVRMMTARVPMATVRVSMTISRVRMATVSVRTTTVRGVPSATNPATTVTVTAADEMSRLAARDVTYGEKKFGPKKFGDKPYGEKKFGDKKFGDRKFVDKPFKPAYKRHDDKPASYPKFNPEKQTGEMRLNGFIAQSGICSRREADDFITAGVVSVNGKIVTELGTKVLPTDEVRFNDEPVQGEKKVFTWR